MREIEFGGSGISRECFDWICEHISHDEAVLELGSGTVSTPALADTFRLVWSIEDNPEYVQPIHGVRYILAPKDSTGWYSVEALRPVPQDYACVLVDGPFGNRREILQHLDLFDASVPWVVHDTHREGDRVMAEDIAHALKKAVTHLNPDFSVIR